MVPKDCVACNARGGECRYEAGAKAFGCHCPDNGCMHLVACDKRDNEVVHRTSTITSRPPPSLSKNDRNIRTAPYKPTIVPREKISKWGTTRPELRKEIVQDASTMGHGTDIIITDGNMLAEGAQGHQDNALKRGERHRNAAIVGSVTRPRVSPDGKGGGSRNQATTTPSRRPRRQHPTAAAARKGQATVLDAPPPRPKGPPDPPRRWPPGRRTLSGRRTPTPHRSPAPPVYLQQRHHHHAPPARRTSATMRRSCREEDRPAATFPGRCAGFAGTPSGSGNVGETAVGLGAGGARVSHELLEEDDAVGGGG
ncbi:hypothetical protein BRADI_2g23693v3 [Brachypodium distachyon]|uniref:Uncharacterized protein n=1 Tax=Brachypodium distachyon TaxID=15368 RepID=A0A2K2DA45_BRADI|nr:hypothetical protein BRADI_2g23693v3 [Brachypodium distachyon]